MAKIVANDGTEFTSLKQANAYEKLSGVLNAALDRVPEDDREAVKRAVLAGVVGIKLPRKPRTKKA